MLVYYYRVICMERYDIKHRLVYVAYKAAELDITIQANFPWGPEYYGKYRERRNAYYDESDYLETLQELGYKYYEKNPAKKDANDYPYVEEDELIELEPQSEPLDINELYKSSDSFKPIISGISMDGIIKLFKNSNIDSQKEFAKKLEENIKKLEDQCIIIENTLLIFEGRNYSGDNAKMLEEWSYDLNKKEIGILKDIKASNELLDWLVNYFYIKHIKYNTGDRESFGTGKIKSKRILPKEKESSGGFGK